MSYIYMCEYTRTCTHIYIYIYRRLRDFRVYIYICTYRAYICIYIHKTLQLRRLCFSQLLSPGAEGIHIHIERKSLHMYIHT